MITHVDTVLRRKRFQNACRGKLCLDAMLPAALQLLGKSQPGRFYTGPTMALDLGGNTAWMAGHANPDELASFLRFCRCKAIVLDDSIGPAPTGWERVCTESIFGLMPGTQLPMPAADEALWQKLRWDDEPPSGIVADKLFPERPARRDDFYSELCTKRNRGKAMVWALWYNEELVCTVGAYAIANGQAYMACGQTQESLRGRGVGGRLIVQMANELAASSLQPVFLCNPERVHFYSHLGFTNLGELTKYKCPELQQ